jgi:hypothetical protein
MRILTTVSLTLIVSGFWWGCGLRYEELRQEQLASEMNSWVGQTRADLIRHWGPPTHESQLASGGSILSYSLVEGEIVVPKDSRVPDVSQNCRKDFEVNSEGEIVSWQYLAAGCL